MADGTPIAAMLMHLIANSTGAGVPQGYRPAPMPVPRSQMPAPAPAQRQQRPQPWVQEHQDEIDNNFWSRANGGNKS